jgi:hypothetical protein
MSNEMATQAQITANRRNARRSTGPKTDTGKRRVSRNARKHGLRSRDPEIAVQETNEFQAMLDSWIESLKPANPAEDAAVVRLVCANTQRLRAAELEARLLIDVNLDNLDAKTRYIAALSTKAHYNFQAAIAFWDRLLDFREVAPPDRMLESPADLPTHTHTAATPGKNGFARSNPIPEAPETTRPGPEPATTPGKESLAQTNPIPETPAAPSTPPAPAAQPRKIFLTRTNPICRHLAWRRLAPGSPKPPDSCDTTVDEVPTLASGPPIRGHPHRWPRL